MTEHITDGTPCWCRPEVTYEHPTDGTKVIVHKNQVTEKELFEMVSQPWVTDLVRDAVMAEREACAKVCDEMGAIEALDGEEGSAAMVRVADKQAALCAADIRARGEK